MRKRTENYFMLETKLDYSAGQIDHHVVIERGHGDFLLFIVYSFHANAHYRFQKNLTQLVEV